MLTRHYIPAIALSLVAFTTGLSAAANKKEACPAKGLEGPSQVINPSVRPFTSDGCCCDGNEFSFTVAALIWEARQEGLEFGILSKNSNPASGLSVYPGNLIEAEFKNPDYKWKGGLKIGLGYDCQHDGWDVEALWTTYRGRAHDEVESDTEDNTTLLPLWSAYSAPVPNPAATNATQGILFANQIDAHWKLDLDMVDLELGREFWTSKYLTLRPHIGFRGAWIRQSYEIEHFGGSWSSPYTTPDNLNDEVNLHNNFKGAGLRGGLDTVWQMGSGWGLFGNFALALVYGHFEVKNHEFTRQAQTPFSKVDVAELKDSFRATRGIADLALGIQYSTMFKDSRYAFTIGLSWENHIFFNQNQLWKINRIGDTIAANPNVSGENVFLQSRGDLSTQGATLTLKLVY